MKLLTKATLGLAAAGAAYVAVGTGTRSPNLIRPDDAPFTKRHRASVSDFAQTESSSRLLPSSKTLNGCLRWSDFARVLKYPRRQST